MKNLEVFQMRCLRRILGITLLDRMRNNVIRERCCNQPTIEEQIQQHRLRWFGHICRMKEKRFPYRGLWKSRPNQWKIQRTAPKKNWIKQIQNYIKNKRLSLENRLRKSHLIEQNGEILYITSEPPRSYIG